MATKKTAKKTTKEEVAKTPVQVGRETAQVNLKAEKANKS